MSLKIIGVMSGTSLDGMDIAYCEFSGFDSNLKGQIILGKTYSYSNEWRSKLHNSRTLSTLALQQLSVEFAELTVELVQRFLEEYQIKEIDYVASHGHTVHHDPDKGITVQIGEGHVISKGLGLPVIFDFRTQDVKFGGQGAPLVPIGDRDLYSSFDACINIGGFANISFQSNELTQAFDICPANVILNPIASKLGYAYDDKGGIAASGELIPSLLASLNNLEYYQLTTPKSLGVEFLDEFVWPLIEPRYKAPDILHTFTVHMAYQITKVIRQNGLEFVLLTGGGALNDFFVEKLKQSGVNVRIATDMDLHFKEAFVFAYLGYLKVNHKINVLSSVTGASHDHITGKLHKP